MFHALVHIVCLSIAKIQLQVICKFYIDVMCIPCGVKMCRYAHTCHGSGCSTVLGHSAFCGSPSGCVCTKKHVARLRSSSFSHQRFEHKYERVTSFLWILVVITVKMIAFL